jgi:hypothetical protein
MLGSQNSWRHAHQPHLGQDVLDEDYRKAGKMDRKDFCTDFHPYDFGVVDAIARTLCQGLGR